MIGCKNHQYLVMLYHINSLLFANITDICESVPKHYIVLVLSEENYWCGFNF